MDIEKTVKNFKRDNNLKFVNWVSLNKIIKENGWLLKSYEESKHLIKEHSLESQVKKYRAFNYNFNGETVILYKQSLRGYQRILSISHEIGHLVLKHNDHSERADDEADEFAYLLVGNFNWLKTPVKIIVIILSILLFIVLENCNDTYPIVIDSSLGQFIPSNTEGYIPNVIATQTLYYISKSGDKYHRLDCYQIDIDNCTSITLEQAVQMGYEPCKTCRPNEVTTYPMPQQ